MHTKACLSPEAHLLSEEGLLAHQGVPDGIHARLAHSPRHGPGNGVVRLLRRGALSALGLWLDLDWRGAFEQAIGIPHSRLPLSCHSHLCQCLRPASLGLLPLVWDLLRPLVPVCLFLLLRRSCEQGVECGAGLLLAELGQVLRAAGARCGHRAHCALAARCQDAAVANCPPSLQIGRQSAPSIRN